MTDPRPQAYEWLRFGDIRPAGWMRNQMRRDLREGFLGRLDELVPGLIRDDDIYGADRLTRKARSKDLGVVAVEKEWESQFLWWNSETQSNWRDGMLRTALLLDDPLYLSKTRAYLAHILQTQDADGYLGIYAPELRYNFTTENGELWAQAALLRGLLGWFEATGEERVLQAVLRAVAVTMRAYPPGNSHPFLAEKDFAGLCHGLMFSDVLDRLYQLTGQAAYLQYARWLYDEYSSSPLSADDIQLNHLLDPSYRFHAHGVHTYEHLRALLTAVYAGPDGRLDQALAAALAKLEPHLAPSGAPIGDENILGRRADATETGYEYCSIHELLDTYTHLLQKTGHLHWANRIEWLLFNAGQGARHPQGHGIAYLKTDNSHSMIGLLHPGDPVDPQNPQTRYKYSPAHQDVAVCCVPNAGRIFPYYVRAMWLRTSAGIFAALYGASQVSTPINGVPVTITQTTNYPFDLDITFTVESPQPVDFELSLRIPEWAEDVVISGVEAWKVEANLIKIQRTWQGSQTIELRLRASVRVQPFGAHEFFVRRGPLLYALPLDGIEKEGRQYPLAGFRDLYYHPAPQAPADLRLPPEPAFEFEPGGTDPAQAWQFPPALTGSLLDAAHRLQVPVRLLPCGATILRQVTFRRAP